MKYYTGQKCER